jgi:hypothetical protein
VRLLVVYWGGDFRRIGLRIRRIFNYVFLTSNGAVRLTYMVHGAFRLTVFNIIFIISGVACVWRKVFEDIKALLFVWLHKFIQIPCSTGAKLFCYNVLKFPGDLFIYIHHLWSLFE